MKNPDFSIIIPVLDEGAVINQALKKLKRLTANKAVEIIVIDGAAGSTIKKIRNPNIITTTSSPGRAKQMNCGAALARSNILIFLHVDTELPAGALEHIKVALERHTAGAFDIDFIGSKFIYKILSHIVYWRSRLTRIPYGDQAFFMRKDYFATLGGFADIPIMEDVELMQRIKKRGDSITLIRQRVKTSARRWQAEGVIYTTIRNLTLSTLFYLGVPATKLATYYKSGKLVYRSDEYK